MGLRGMGNGREDYEFDAFISYRRLEFSREWVGTVFIPEFTQRLAIVLGYTPKIFWDDKSVEDGQVPREIVLQGLKRSRCLISLLSGPYFTSQWCVAEWETFRQRAKQAESSGSLKKGESLTLPLQWQDGDAYADRIGAEGFQARDFRNYRKLSLKRGEGNHSRDYDDFETDLNELAERVSRLIGSAPNFQENWPIVNPDEVKIGQTKAGQWTYTMRHPEAA